MSQSEKLFKLLSDGKPHRTDEIIRAVYNMDQTSVARIGARIHDLKKKHDVKIESYPDKNNKKLWFYQLIKKVELGMPCECGRGYLKNALMIDASYYKCTSCGVIKKGLQLNPVGV